MRRRCEEEGLQVLRPCVGSILDLEGAMLDRATGQSRASDTGNPVQCHDKQQRLYEHDYGGAKPNAWRENGFGNIDGLYNVKHVENIGSSSNSSRVVYSKRVLVELSEQRKTEDESLGGAPPEWRVPPPSVGCFLATTPRTMPNDWKPCLEPHVPRNMACWWMTSSRN